MKIEEFREQIDVIDDKLAALSIERMTLVKEIGLEKARGDRPVADPGREKAVIGRVVKNAPPELRAHLERIFHALFETSKEYQVSVMSDKW